MYESPEVLFGIDPPYLPATRWGNPYYEHEMTEDDHVRLLATANQLSAKAYIHGYPSELYDDMLAGWKRMEFDLHCRVAGSPSSPTRRTEVVWINWH